jgi:chemotaxis protein methyltransferase CheR
MKNRIPDTLLSQLSEFVAARTALHFPRERWSDLERRAGSAAKEFGFTDNAEFIRWITSSYLTGEQIEILASHLTISETYFWREPRTFDALQEQVLPELVRSREKGERRLRIWSAGCATGEEPYSIAIALRRAIAGREDWRISILATDISPRILAKAMAGVYGKWSFRNAPAWLKKEYFHPQEDGMIEILPEIRKMVTFEYLNLAEDIYPSPLNNTNVMDVIFCRNVLMYFAPERTGQVVKKFYQCLTDGGWLIVGASELSQQMFPQFTPVNFPEAIFYRKVQQESRSYIEPPPEFSFVVVNQVSPGTLVTEKETMPEVRGVGPQPAVDLSAFERCDGEQDEEVTEEIENKETPRAVALSVRRLADRGELAEALALCEKAIAENKLDPGMHYLRAIILQEQNSEAEAIASVKRAIYLDADFVLANFVLGNLLVRRGNSRAGKRYFENVLALLGKFGREEILPESDGLTAGRLREIIQATQSVYEDEGRGERNERRKTMDERRLGIES